MKATAAASTAITTITTTKTTTITMSDRAPSPVLTSDGLFQLMAWLSPSFPVGSFSYSHGLEAAIERGAINDRATLEAWIGGILKFGARATDALLFRAAHAAGSDKAIARVIERADAWRGTPEPAHESAAQRHAFPAPAHAACP